MRFTPLEQKILQDRLDQPDCLAETLYDEFDEVNVISRALEIDLDGPVDVDDPLTGAIIIDCAEGSTMLVATRNAADAGAISFPDYLAFCRAAKSLEVKLGVRIPR